ncbi:glycoside hydrolase family 15 protein [Sinobaca sp. H24]|uniref:glycoside hydrolase family 15 protein n=1 Tax=Sinobaca sp. H24 TaxID=2923376 RepID=UPI00207996F2|nr:glycoside hydrolase family 15 protein [Sinobaca sp. H24]
MRKKPYVTDAIIGNGNMLISLTKDGEAHRLYWPQIDYTDQINAQSAGFYDYETEKTLFFHGKSWKHTQYYRKNTNVLITVHQYEDWVVEQKDFVLSDRDVWIRRFKVRNTADYARKVQILYNSDSAAGGRHHFQTSDFDENTDCLYQYNRSDWMGLASPNPITNYFIGNLNLQALPKPFDGRSVFNHPESSLFFDFDTIEPQEEHAVSIYLACGTNKREVTDLIWYCRREEEDLEEITAEYWYKVLEKAERYSYGGERTQEIYDRSILTFHLLKDKKSGTFIAGPEGDENYDFSGGYAYSWGRDAAFIAAAVDAAGYPELVDEYYRTIASWQMDAGHWEQRYYTDGQVAPNWGVQIDETGSILWGIHDHYVQTGDKYFKEIMWPTVKKGAFFLKDFIDKETNLPKPSKDLWEKRDGEHSYSAAAVYGGMIGASKLAYEEGEYHLAETWEKVAVNIKEALQTRVWNEKKGSFLRALKLAVSPSVYEEAVAEGKEGFIEYNEKGTSIYYLWEDDVTDICLLGLNYPFNVFDAEDKRMQKTADLIEAECTSAHIGGIERFPGDVYIGGNPWIITTLWLAIYKKRSGKSAEAHELFQWTIGHANHLGLLPEQVDKHTAEPAWVMPLTWSHAMFVLAVKEMSAEETVHHAEEDMEAKR